MIEPGRDAIVRFSLTVPAEAPPAGYRTGILFEFGPAAANRRRHRREVQVRSRIATLVYANVGEPPAAVELVDLRSRRTPNQPAQIVAILKNTGRRTVTHARHASRCSTRAARSSARRPIPDVPVLPESEREVAIPAHRSRQAGPAGRRLPRRSQDRRGDARAPRRRNDAQASLGRECGWEAGDDRGRARSVRERPAAAQQGSVQLSSETQIVASDPSRRTGEPGFQPDFGINWMEPQSRLRPIPDGSPTDGNGDNVRLGRTSIGVRDLQVARLQVDVRGRRHLYDAGNRLSILESLGAGGHVQRRVDTRATSARTSFQVLGGQSTALRNVFGTEPGRPRPDAGNRAASYQASDRLQLNGRAAHTRTWDLDEFVRTVDASDQGGFGARVIAKPMWQFVADGSYVHYRATGATSYVSDYSYLAGAHVLLSRGWIQVNASRFSPGDLPVLNASLQDRSGIFSAAEYRRAQPPAALRGLGERQHQHQSLRNGATRPEDTVERGYGGARVQVAGDPASRCAWKTADDSGTRPSSPRR